MRMHCRVLLLWMLLLLRSLLALWLRSGFTLLLRRSLLALWLRSGFTLLLRRGLLALWLRSGMALLLWQSLLALWLRSGFTLLLLRSLLALWLRSLALLLLRIYLTLLLLLSCLALLLLRIYLALLRIPLTLLELLSALISYRSRRWDSHVAIGCKRPVDGHAGRMAMIDIGKLCPVGAGRTLVLHLRCHGRSMLLMYCIQFSGSGSHLDPARTAVETHTGASPVISANRMVIHMVHDGGIDVID